MFTLSSETYVAWATGLLWLGAVLAALGGAGTLARANRARYYVLRRQSLLRGWQLIFLSLFLAVGGGVFYSLGLRAMEAVHPPTLTLPPSATLTITPIPSDTPTLTLSPSLTPIPEDTLTPSLTPTASPTPTFTPSPTPALPLNLITPPSGATVMPPAEAIAVNLRLSQRDNCVLQNGVAFFDQVPKTIYVHFFYENWLPGMQWSGVWLRDGQVIYTETSLWDGSTGGCGFTNFDNAKLWWPAGDYEVQLFAGERWLISIRFPIVRSTPTSTVTATRTPRTPTATFTPSLSPTRRPTNTVTSTRTPRTPTLTFTPTNTRTPRPSWTPTHTRTPRTPRPTWTPTFTRTPRPTVPTWTPSLTRRPTLTPTESATP